MHEDDIRKHLADVSAKHKQHNTMNTFRRLRLLVGLAIGAALYFVPSAHAQYAITAACQDSIENHEIANGGLAVGCTLAAPETGGLSCALAGANWVYSVYRLVRDCRTPPPPPPPPKPKPLYDPSYGYFDYYDPVDVVSYSSQFMGWSSGCYVSGYSGPGELQN